MKFVTATVPWIAEPLITVLLVGLINLIVSFAERRLWDEEDGSDASEVADTGAGAGAGAIAGDDPVTDGTYIPTSTDMQTSARITFALDIDPLSFGLLR
ncbi:MAG TPA: hypothetical protein VI893_06885 [Thermoplasmata archaeon]|nr:hypothetical protein [Thermoplasmata archaeon]